MAHTFVKNSLSNLKNVKVNINFLKYVNNGSDGDPIWIIEAASTYPPASGTKITPSYVNNIDTLENVDEAISQVVSEVAKQIDWLPLVRDDSPPYVVEVGPLGSDVSIASNIYIDIKDDAPSSGIDLSDVKIFINNSTIDIDITEQCIIEGDPFFYTIRWEPTHRLPRHYEE